VPLGIARRARRAGVELELTLCDVSPRALDWARQRAVAADLKVDTLVRDATVEPLPGGFDVALCSLFLHHLDEPAATAVLGKLAAAARLVLVHDLRRSSIGFAVAWLGARVLTRCAVVHVDGPRSARAAYTLREARGLATRAGLAAARVRPTWPWRWLLEWQR
jgi:SAM-dependent methyltransferase